MRKNLSIIFTLTLIATFIACRRERTFYTEENIDLSNKAQLKVYDAVVSATRNYVYADNVPLTGTSLAIGSTFPGNISYSAINPGNKTITIRDTLLSSSQLPITFTNNFEAGKYYTVFLYDTLNNVKFKVVEDKISIPADTSSSLRFANLIYSKTAVPNVDIYSKNMNREIFSNVSIGQVTDFINYPSKVVDSFFVKETGTFNLLAGLLFTPQEKRIYTIVFRGRYQTIGITAISRTLTFFTNR
jgi:hypothetical protein